MSTRIEWTEKSWNPVVGCTPIAEGCRNCYAARDAFRMAGNGKTPYYKGLATKAKDERPVFTGVVRCLEEKLDLPLRWKKPLRVFVPSMSDLFHPAIPEGFVGKVFEVMARCPRHTFLVLTKRPGRMLELMARWNPLPNVWFGVSAEDQATADERVPLLLQVPAATWFVSHEPSLEEVDFTPYLGAHGLDLIIAGGESGARARPCNVEWIRSVVRQCRAAGVAVFVKQLGSRPLGARVTHKKGGEPSEWPEDLRVREWPEPSGKRGVQLCLV